jgi:hypothetical protein
LVVAGAIALERPGQARIASSGRRPFSTKAICFPLNSTQEETNMKLRTIALAAAFALSSTFALAQQNEATGAQGGATGVPGVKTNPTPEQAAQGGATGVPGIKTNPTPEQATSTSGTSGTAINKGTADPSGSTAPPKAMTK